MGTRWLDHKLRATGRMIDRFALYTRHLQNFMESSKPSDRGPLRGKIELLEAKVILRGAIFSDILHEARKLSLVTQKPPDINITDMVEAVESCKRNYERLLIKLKKDQNYAFTNLPTVKTVIQKIEANAEEDGKPVFQGQKLKYYL